MNISELNQYPLRHFRSLFASLELPDPQTLGGKYRGSFVGPGWVRALAKPALLMTGLDGWWGKVLYNDGRAMNILLRDGELLARFPMRVRKEKSHIDSRDGLSLYYEKDNPLLWLFIVDEIRRIDSSRLLGMSRPTVPGFRWFALPFVLEKQES